MSADGGVQNDTLGHRGRRNDPLYRARRRLVMRLILFKKATKSALVWRGGVGWDVGDHFAGRAISKAANRLVLISA